MPRREDTPAGSRLHGAGPDGLLAPRREEFARNRRSGCWHDHSAAAPGRSRGTDGGGRRHDHSAATGKIAGAQHRERRQPRRAKPPDTGRSTPPDHTLIATKPPGSGRTTSPGPHPGATKPPAPAGARQPPDRTPDARKGARTQPRRAQQAPRLTLRCRSDPAEVRQQAHPTPGNRPARPGMPRDHTLDATKPLGPGRGASLLTARPTPRPRTQPELASRPRARRDEGARDPSRSTHHTTPDAPSIVAPGLAREPTRVIEGVAAIGRARSHPEGVAQAQRVRLVRDRAAIVRLRAARSSPSGPLDLDFGDSAGQGVRSASSVIELKRGLRWRI
ncbi:hypothetical protein BKA15_006262 [Microlunatus parietis]|uniref:Uncharacterized protein n=1 Tax=Microlunatus parietis TaxID=682979 RepID=A0A7Y9IE93_9ACTN|nr:hypothetical protein [Microlunatus parietis]